MLFLCWKMTSPPRGKKQFDHLLSKVNFFWQNVIPMLKKGHLLRGERSSLTIFYRKSTFLGKMLLLCWRRTSPPSILKPQPGWMDHWICGEIWKSSQREFSRFRLHTQDRRDVKCKASFSFLVFHDFAVMMSWGIISVMTQAIKHQAWPWPWPWLWP